ncbi:MAG: DUF2711 family protein [Terracidiphilus sp.]
MKPEQFIYPSYSEPLVQAYGGRFECAFIVLHPFVRVPEALNWSAAQHYPDDGTIAAQGTRCAWAEVVERAGLQNCARLNQALLSSIGSLDEDLADPAGRDALQRFLETQPVWMPVEGRFEPLLQADFLAAFRETAELISVPEFPESDPVVRLPVAGLLSSAVPFPARGTLLAPDASFLFTVDWDSFFTLFYGSRDFVTRVAAERGLEGFSATANTEHAWFNYSFGCATVTLSPEHWQTR